MLGLNFFMVILIMAATCVAVVLILRGRGIDRPQADLQLGTQSVCPHCRLLNPTHARFCGHCGKALQ